jgi:dipeptidase E
LTDSRRILAMGGGGFTMEPGNPALDRYVLELGRARRPDPRVCLLPTAGGDSEEQIFRFYAAFSDEACEPTHVSLFRLGRRPISIHSHLLEQDVIYVGGGSMLNLLAIWRAHRIDRTMREAWERGIVLCGISAGSMCWFAHGITTSTGHPEPVSGLGFLSGSNSVHYDGEPHRRLRYLEAVRSGEVPGGFGVDDGAAILFEGTRRAEIVSSRPRAGATSVRRTRGGEIVETRLVARVLEAHMRPGPPPEITELRAVRAARRDAMDRRRSARFGA